ncbi:protein-disulfide reductase DsbD [Camelimonas sp. ID_303_24]
MSQQSPWRRVVLALLVMLGGLFAASASARTPSAGAAPLPADRAFQLSATRGDDDSIRFAWAVAPGYYLYRDKFAFQRGGADLPAPALQGDGRTLDDPTFGVTTVFYNHARAVIAGVGERAGTIEVGYQGCQENGICYPPVVRQIDLATLAISAAPPRATSPLAGAWAAPPASAAPGGGIIVDNGDGMVSGLLKQGGALVVLGSFMLFGVLLAFTPCVFPMYPILAGTIARQGEAVTAWRGFSLSLAYVLAMAAAFGLLGVAAAWSGQNLQMALQSPPAIIAVSALFLALALSMFGLFEMQLPASWVNAVGGLGQGRRGSLASAGLLGFTSALIVGPCVTAPLAGALIYIAQTGDVALGAAALFALGLGKGIPLVAFGALGPKALPKAGPWMAWTRQGFGFIFIATAIWMLSRIIAPEAGLALWSALAIGVAVWLGAFDAIRPDAGRFGPGARVARAAGLVAALYGVILGVGAATGAGDPLRPLGRLAAGGAGVAAPREHRFHAVDTATALQARMAAAKDRPSLVYVTADWCVACSVIERAVLPDAAVQSALGQFNLIKLDVSDNAPEQQELMQRLQVAGPPTMIFVSPEGRETSGTRLVGDVTRATLLASAGKAEGSR